MTTGYKWTGFDLKIGMELDGIRSSYWPIQASTDHM